MVGTNRQTNGRTEGHNLKFGKTHFLNNDMLIVICLKISYDGTSASLKPNLTKHFNLRIEWMNRQTNKRTEGRHNFINIGKLAVICVKFQNNRTSASLKTTLTKNFNLSMEWTDGETNGRTDGHRVTTSNWHNFVYNYMLKVICVKFHHDRTSTYMKTKLAKNFNPSGTDGLTDRKTICLSCIVCQGKKICQIMIGL